MKPPEIESRLWHVAAACEKVLRVTAALSFEEYVSHDLVPDVVVRQLTIIGEAVSRIARTDAKIASRLGDFPRIIGLRNQLVHNYPAVDPDAVWLIVKRDVPVLGERVRSLLASRSIS